MPKEKIATPESVGNQFGYLCPNCGQGDCLHVYASTSVSLCPGETEVDSADQEWGQDSGASCSHCDWCGTVSQFKQAPNLEADWNPALDLPKSRLLES